MISGLVLAAALAADPTIGPCDIDGITWANRCGSCPDDYLYRQGASAGECTVDVLNSTTPPATCAVGQTYFDTNASAGSRFLLCTSANTWTGMDDAGVAGAGDVSDVGAGCSTGACWTDGLATSGTTLMVWEGSTANGNQTTWTIAADPAAAYSIAWPSASGTVAVSASAPVTLSAAGAIALTQNAGTDVTADLEEEANIRGTAVSDNAADTEILVGDGAATAKWVAMSGDTTIANTGAVDLVETAVEAELEGVIDLADLQGQITDSQIADGTVDGGTGGEIADGSVTAADLGTDSVSADELNATGVETELEAVLDLDQLQGQIGDAQIADAAVDGGTGGEVADDTITAADLAATITLSDGDLIDADAINLSSATEGILLPQATDVSAATAEGQIGWETDANKLWVGDGAAAAQVDGQPSTIFIPPGSGATLGISSVGTTESGYGVFPGYDLYHGTKTYKVTGNIYAVSGSPTCGFAILDKTGSTTICTSGTTTATAIGTIVVCDFGTVSNVDNDPALWSFAVTVSGAGTCRSLGGAQVIVE